MATAHVLANAEGIFRLIAPAGEAGKWGLEHKKGFLTGTAAATAGA